jgi:hypothetical protein
MTDEELITRLRLLNEVDANVAAHRIEALVKQCEGLAQAAMNNGQALILAEARAERLEAALRKIDVGEGWAAQIAREALK